MDWSSLEAPTLGEFEALARKAFASLPQAFQKLCDGIVMQVEEFPSAEVCADMGLESPFELTGLYQGVDLTRKSVSDVGALPDMVFLFRRPILDEWSEGGESLGHLVRHILIHEIGHHFGLSDEDMDAIAGEDD